MGAQSLDQVRGTQQGGPRVEKIENPRLPGAYRGTELEGGQGKAGNDATVVNAKENGHAHKVPVNQRWIGCRGVPCVLFFLVIAFRGGQQGRLAAGIVRRRQAHSCSTLLFFLVLCDTHPGAAAAGATAEGIVRAACGGGGVRRGRQAHGDTGNYVCALPFQQSDPAPYLERRRCGVGVLTLPAAGMLRSESVPKENGRGTFFSGGTVTQQKTSWPEHAPRT
jgi:hypothetical protein